MVYWPVCHYGFVNYDDDVYVTANAHVRSGLTLHGLVWAFTTNYAANWHPLTWLSHMLDWQLWGGRAGAHHLVNVLLHIANTLLLFGVLSRMTASAWRSALVAGLFALHPLHVESVAWVSERKDVLSTCFWLLSMWAYVRYAEQPGSRRYLTALGLYALGLMAKPMVITLPFVLLLLDYWPLGRTPWTEALGSENVLTPPSQLIREKLPFLALGAMSAVLTYWVQRSGGAVVPLVNVSMGTRIANALLSYMRYVWMTFWPMKLAVFYPLHGGVPLTTTLAAAAALLGITATVIWWGRRGPWFVTGWFWYLGTLVPVIGLVQVGAQSMADRYTYVPSIGLFIMVCWCVQCRAMKWPIVEEIALVAAGAALALCMVLSRLQVGYWKDSETLFRHALAVTQNNWVAHNNLGIALGRAGNRDEAIDEWEQALRIRPDYAEAHNNLGLALSDAGKLNESIGHYEQALALKPDLVEANYNLGVALLQTGKAQDAISHLEQVLRTKPDYADAHNNLGIALSQTGKPAEAIEHYEQALRIRPDYAEAHNNLGFALSQIGKNQEAIGQYEESLRINPDYAEAHNNLGLALSQVGNFTNAIEHYEQALRIKPDYAEAHNNLGLALSQTGKPTEAIEHYKEALRLRPDSAEIHCNLGAVLEKVGRIKEAIGQYEQALSIKPDYAAAQNKLAQQLATLAPAEGGDPVQAVTLAQRACELTGNQVAEYLDTLATAYAAAGRFDDAVTTAQKAIELARAAGQAQLVKEIEMRLELYRAGRAHL